MLIFSLLDTILGASMKGLSLCLLRAPCLRYLPIVRSLKPPSEPGSLEQSHHEKCACSGEVKKATMNAASLNYTLGSTSPQRRRRMLTLPVVSVCVYKQDGVSLESRKDQEDKFFASLYIYF